MNQLVRYESARKALAEAVAVDEVKEIHDQAVAMSVYAKHAKDRVLEVYAAEIRMRAERRLGEMLAQQKANGGMASGGEHGGRAKLDGSREEPSNPTPTLDAMGIDKKLSSRAQKTAAVTEDEFEQALAEHRDQSEPIAPKFFAKPHVSHNSQNDEWYTPAWIMERAQRVLGGIDLDPASSSAANVTVGAKTFYDIDRNGLDQNWKTAQNIWLNPPYSQPLIGMFIDKLIAEGDVWCCLVNNATDTAWGQSLLGNAKMVCFVNGRVKFQNATGQEVGSPLQGQLIAYRGPALTKFRREFSTVGVVLRP